ACSAGSLRSFFAARPHPAIPDSAESASLAKARSYWQRDRTTPRALAGLGGGVHLVRQAWNGITDPDYRRACYERGGIVERLTLYGVGKPCIFASAYRTRDSGHSNADQLEALEQSAPVIIALIEQHEPVHRLTALAQPHPLPA